MLKKIILSAKARNYIETHQINDITIDIESYGECCVSISEAVVTTGVPMNATDFEHIEHEGLSIYTYKSMEFVGNTIKIGLSKGFLKKKHLTAGDLKLL